MRQSAKEHTTLTRTPEKTDWTPAPDNRTAFKDEARRIEKNGGVSNSGNLNRINSPGKKFREQDGD